MKATFIVFFICIALILGVNFFSKKNDVIQEANEKVATEIPH